MGGVSSKVTRRRDVFITLDALGTIYRFKEPLMTQYIKVARRCGVTQQIDEARLQQAFKASYKDINKQFPHYAKEMCGPGSPEFFWQLVVDETFQSVLGKAPSPELSEELYQHFSSSAAHELFTDVKPFFAEVQELRQEFRDLDDSAITVGVISNSDPRFSKILKSLGLRVGPDLGTMRASTMRASTMRASTMRASGPDWGDELRRQIVSMETTGHPVFDNQDIDFLVSSYEVESEKPDDKIFKRAEQKGYFALEWRRLFTQKRLRFLMRHALRRKVRSEFIHIGDDYNKDYLGAKRAGWEAFHLVRDEKYAEPDAEDHTIVDLRQALVPIRIMLESLRAKKR